MAPFSRRRFLTGGAAAMTAAAFPPATSDLAIERRTFVVPGLHPAHDGLKVVQLSDLHVGVHTPATRVLKAIVAANAFEPDLVVLTGDYLTMNKRDLGQIPEQLAGLKAPTVAILGNHDYWVDPVGAARALRGLGYDLLRNQHTQLTLRGERFSVVGIDDLWTKHHDVDRAFAGVPQGSKLVLAHVPRTADLLRERDEPLLVLAGHTHGGGLNVPGLTPFVLRTLAREPYREGAFDVDKVQLYVSRGVGMRWRLNADPEVTLLTLRSAEVVAAGV